MLTSGQIPALCPPFVDATIEGRYSRRAHYLTRRGAISLAIDKSQGVGFQRLHDYKPLANAEKPKQADKPTTSLTPPEPKDLGFDVRGLETPASRNQQPATPPEARLATVSVPATPTTLASLETPSLLGQTPSEHKTENISLVPLNLLGLSQGGKSLPSTPVGQALRQRFVYAQSYDQDRVDLPFAYPASPHGLIDQNELTVALAGLRNLGADEAARGLLENWLELGERYTALPGRNSLNELGRSGMPRLSSALVEESKSNPDPDFLPRSYKVIADDLRQNWGDTYFKATPNGLTRFCDVDYSHDATLDESGGPKNTARFDGDPMPFNPVDLNAYLFRTEKDLQTMATALQGRAMAAGDQEAASQWKDQAHQWGQKAERRKEAVLETMWDADQGLFFDHKFKETPPARSEVKTLAAFSVLDAEMLDPSNPAEKKIVDALVASLPGFSPNPGEPPVWDDKGGQKALPADVFMVASGLEKYGYKSQATALKQGLRGDLSQNSITNDLGEIGIRAALEEPVTGRTVVQGADKLVGDQLGDWLSPRGLDTLRRLAPPQDAPLQVAARDAGRLDRRLRSVHSSLTSPSLVRQLESRGLTEMVYGIRRQDSAVSPVDLDPSKYGPAQTLEKGATIDLSGVQLSTGLSDTEFRTPGPDTVVFTKNGHNLVLARVEDKLLVGDRAYDLSSFKVKNEQGQTSIDLSRDILGSFPLAGDNKQLETFYDANREWIPAPLRGKSSAMADLPSKPGLVALNETIGDNWSQLTVAPSVGPKDTGMQIFNAAAVPSLGIFKTQFNWDTLFMAKGMQLQGHQKTVSGMTDNLLYLLKSTGRVPNAARSVYLNKSQPPILPALVRMSAPLREAEQGTEFTEQWLGEAYKLMGRDYNDFWSKPGEGERGVTSIDGQPTHLSRWGGPNHKFAMDESGLDTTSRYYGKTLDLVPPDLQGFLFRYANDMSEIASELSVKARDRGDLQGAQKYTLEAAHWKGQAQQRKEDTIKYCWDEADGMFRDYRFQGEGQGLAREEDSLSAAMGPLWVGMLDPQVPREKEMIERSLANMARFEKDHGVGSTAEDYGHPEMQWNGPSGWAPHHMMAVEAATRYGDYATAGRIASKWLDTIHHVHSRDGIILERYDVVKGDHPPVQAGRYEETQGEGPGFGWTNASVPWALIEVIGGARIERSGDQATLNLTPHIPQELEGSPVGLTFVNPNGKGEWQIEHRYDSQEDFYNLALSGDFSETDKLVVTTPPLTPGLLPKLQGPEGTDPPAYTLQQQPSKDGKVRYRFSFDELSGEQSLNLRLAASAPETSREAL